MRVGSDSVTEVPTLGFPCWPRPGQNVNAIERAGAEHLLKDGVVLKSSEA